MSDIPETPSTNPKTCTNEISIQVEIDPTYDYFSKPDLRFSAKYPNRNLEIDPSYSHKTVKLKKSNPSVIIQSFRRNSQESNGSLHENPSNKKIGLEISLNKKIANHESCLQKRSQSNDLITQQQIKNRLKLLAENNCKSKESHKIKDSKAAIVKSPSSYQIPPVFDPLINFSSKILTKNAKFGQIKPKVYKKYKFGAFHQISSHNLSSAQSRFESFSQLKKKYFFRKHSNLFNQA
jgi:hypothetical protein